VAGSTVFPAGAPAAGAAVLSVDSGLLPPQPVIAMANAPTASEYMPNLVFLTKQFLLFTFRISLTHYYFKQFLALPQFELRFFDPADHEAGTLIPTKHIMRKWV